MKILLLKDVKKVGQKGQVVEVSEGYGRNFLIKGGFGKTAIGGILKEVDNKKNLKKQNEKKQIEEELKILGEVSKQEFILNKKNDNGHLFAAVNKKEISEISGVPEKSIILNGEIKNLGKFEIAVSLGNKKGKIFLIVE